MHDTVYFNSKVAPGELDWIHCKVLSVKPEGIQVAIQVGYQKAKHFYPSHVITRIEYGSR